MSQRLVDDCFRPDDARLTHGEAIGLLKARLTTIAGVERVPLKAAAGRILAADIRAAAPVPAHTNAAVDGYAFRAASYDRAAGSTFRIAGRAAAGHPLDEPVAHDAAVRILTGAVMPAGLDTCAMQEDVEVVAVADAAGHQQLRVPPGLKPGANVRQAGEDVAAGTVLLTAGSVLRPQDIAAVASVGPGEIAVHRRLRVAIASTGDEVRPPGSGPLKLGNVYDANADMLHALVALAGAEPTALGIWQDEPSRVEAALAEAAGSFDVVLTSGGASRGEEDHVAAALARRGTCHFWQLAIKPGRPMMLGQIGNAAVVGLPGNPVAVFVCFLMYVHPMLGRLGGAGWREPARYRLPAAFDFKGRKRGRREFWRAMLVPTESGLKADKFARDGSGLISGLRAADGLIEIDEDHGDVAVGDPVAFIPLTEFGIPAGGAPATVRA
jgi:molybdopterin molybdotransferase